MKMNNFYVKVKNITTNEVVKELGPMSERKADKVADGIEINMSDDFYTEIVKRSGKSCLTKLRKL